MKRKYTEKIHAERLIRILERKNTCDWCPAKAHSVVDAYSCNPLAIWVRDTDPCTVCLDFVDAFYHCPCTSLGEEEAIKRTWIALEEKGYI